MIQWELPKFLKWIFWLCKQLAEYMSCPAVKYSMANIPTLVQRKFGNVQRKKHFMLSVTTQMS